MKKMYRYLLIALFVCCVNYSQAQLITTNAAPYNTVQYLVDSVLLGPGVTAFNHTYSGWPVQLGYFDGSGCNVGMPAGLIMTSGSIFNAPGPNNSSSTSQSCNNNASDADVTSIIGQITRDCAVIEFDFIAPSDSISFDYVWSSEEYSEYVFSVFNDGFGFFISGPGINGPFTNNAENIALIPVTAQYVTINNLNNGWAGSGPPTGPCNNCQFWNYNGDGFSPPYNGSNFYIEYDGLSDVLTARSAQQVSIQCGQQYHIKLVICDGIDQIYDSGIFLLKNSFQSTGGWNVVSTATFTNGGNVYGDSALVEGCGYTVLDFVRVNDSLPDTLFFTITGTATNGIDYTWIPDSIFFAAGQDSAQIIIDPLFDGIPEGIETIIIQIIDTNNCIGDTITLEFTIEDPLALITSTVDDTIDCLVDSVLINVSITQGLPGFNYLWNTGDTVAQIWVSPTNTTSYFVSVTDTCGIVTEDTVTVVVLDFPIIVDAPDQGIMCPGDTTDIWVSISGGLPPYQWWWSNGAPDTIQSVSPMATTTYYVSVTDLCAEDTIVDSVTVYMQIFPPMELHVIDIVVNCPGDPVAIAATATGGTGGYVFTWDNWATLTDSIVVNPDTTTVYTVIVTDDCPSDTISMDVTVTVPNFPPMSLITSQDQYICPGESAKLFAIASGGTGIYTFDWGYFSGETDTVTVFPDKSTTYNLIVTDECGNTLEQEITVYVIVPDAEFSYEHKGDNLVQFTNESSPDAIIFEWDMGNGYGTTVENPLYSYPVEDQYIITLIATNQYDCSDTAVMLIRPPLQVWIPNAFTPNGDDVNDYFRPSGLGMREYQIWIFNRWGELLFTSQDVEDVWTGKDAPVGVYVWRIVAKGYEKDEIIEKIGHVTLIK